MKTMKKLLRKLILSILVDEDGFIKVDSSINVKGSISASGDIVSYSTSKVNNEEITKK